MNVEIGAEAALFPEKEYISGIFVAVQYESLPQISGTFLFFAPDIFHILFLFLQCWARLSALKVLK
jgi:hypothetical protein